VEELNRLTEELGAALQQIGAAAYGEQGGPETPPPGDMGGGPETPPDDDVVDGEFSEA
jgi:hypothetical protein